MKTTQTFRLTPLLVALLFLAACAEETIGPVSDLSEQAASGQAASNQALSFEGPSRAVFEIGQMQSANYYATHSTAHDFDVEVTHAPAGAGVEIVELNAFEKRVTLNWNPGYDAEGILHPVSLKASTASSEWTGEFEIYVALSLRDEYVPPEVDDDEPFFENKAVGTRK